MRTQRPIPGRENKPGQNGTERNGTERDGTGRDKTAQDGDTAGSPAGGLAGVVTDVELTRRRQDEQTGHGTSDYAGAACGGAGAVDAVGTAGGASVLTQADS